MLKLKVLAALPKMGVAGFEEIASAVESIVSMHSRELKLVSVSREIAAFGDDLRLPVVVLSYRKGHKLLDILVYCQETPKGLRPIYASTRSIRIEATP